MTFHFGSRFLSGSKVQPIFRCIQSGRSLSHFFHWAKETDKLWEVVLN